MTFPIASIAKLLMQLATITPPVNNSIEKIRQLIDTIRKPGAGTQNQLDDLKKAIELQAAVNKEMNDKLKLIETVLQTVQKSLKILAVTGAGVGLIALIALVIAVMK
jgi:predicted PurR-regulated permease PerM